MEERVSQLERNFAELRSEIKEMHRSLQESKRFTRIWLLSGVAVILGALAHGFKWI
jgi:hypothetical protein